VSAYKPCGECSLCCKALPVPQIDKPAGQWCRHFRAGTGCAIHAERPSSCRQFQCLWSAAEILDESWRPDRCGLVIWSDTARRIIIDPDPDDPEAFRREPFWSQIRVWSERDTADWHEVLIRVGDRVLMVFPEGEVDLGRMQPGRQIDSGYRLEGGRMVPYARFGEITSSGLFLTPKG
jgi:hypothetical protein